jgi:hypothetical protein
MPPTPPPRPHVEPCSRCGQPAERPAVATGHGGREGRDRLPLCVDCLTLLLEDVRAHGAGFSRRGQRRAVVRVRPAAAWQR